MTAEPLQAPAPEETVAAIHAGRGRTLLSLVPSPVRARRAPFVALLISLLAGGLIGLLLLNTASAQDSFRLHDLQDQAADTQKQLQQYSGSDDGLDDPAVLYLRAAALGMVPGDIPVFLAKGQPVPKGAVRVGNMVYIPGPKPIPTPSAVATTPAVPSTVPTPKATAKSTAPAKPKTAATTPAKQPAAGTTKAPSGTTSKAPSARTTTAPAKAQGSRTPVKPKATTPAARVTEAPAAAGTGATGAKATPPATTVGGH